MYDYVRHFLFELALELWLTVIRLELDAKSNCASNSASCGVRPNSPLVAKLSLIHSIMNSQISPKSHSVDGLSRYLETRCIQRSGQR